MEPLFPDITALAKVYGLPCTLTFFVFLSFDGTSEDMLAADIATKQFRCASPANLAELGGCPRIGIYSQIEVFWKNKHSHIVDIVSIIFTKITKSWGEMHSRTGS